MESTFICPSCNALLAIELTIRSKRVLRESKDHRKTLLHDLRTRYDFTPRMMFALNLMLEGYSHRQIASEMGTSVQVVKNIICTGIYKKLGVRNQLQFYAAVVSDRFASKIPGQERDNGRE
jgi:DNA-binding NarL/FixJ family response regulator